MKNSHIRIGTAGWNIPSSMRHYFPQGTSVLEKYSQIFNAVEINSSFYRAHKKSLYERWAASTPDGFQFAVKMPKQITHDNRLIEIEAHLESFINALTGLQTKLGPLLIQLPPSLHFDANTSSIFFKLLRTYFNGRVVLEPRHISWAQSEAVTMLHIHSIERVNADPLIVPIETKQKRISQYYRLHGSPQLYSSSYDDEFLDELSNRLNDSSWVIFDNTRWGAATQNALDLKHKSDILFR